MEEDPRQFFLEYLGGPQGFAVANWFWGSYPPEGLTPQVVVNLWDACAKWGRRTHTGFELVEPCNLCLRLTKLDGGPASLYVGYQPLASLGNVATLANQCLLDWQDWVEVDAVGRILAGLDAQALEEGWLKPDGSRIAKPAPAADLVIHSAEQKEANGDSILLLLFDSRPPPEVQKELLEVPAGPIFEARQRRGWVDQEGLTLRAGRISTVLAANVFGAWAWGIRFTQI